MHVYFMWIDDNRCVFLGYYRSSFGFAFKNLGTHIHKTKAIAQQMRRIDQKNNTTIAWDYFKSSQEYYTNESGSFSFPMSSASQTQKKLSINLSCACMKTQQKQQKNRRQTKKQNGKNSLDNIIGAHIHIMGTNKYA